MRRTITIAIAMAAMLVFALATTAVAGKPDCKPNDPDCQPADDPLWTCQARIDNGATAWVPGLWIGADGTEIEIDLSGEGPLPERYRADTASGAIPACIDIHPGHFSETSWTVTWRADDDTVISDKGTKSGMGGLLMVFEREVHDGSYDDFIARTVDGVWVAQLPADGVDNLAFVAMPSRRDSWSFTDGYLEVAPSS